VGGSCYTGRPLTAHTERKSHTPSCPTLPSWRSSHWPPPALHHTHSFLSCHSLHSRHHRTRHALHCCLTSLPLHRIFACPLHCCTATLFTACLQHLHCHACCLSGTSGLHLGTPLHTQNLSSLPHLHLYPACTSPLGGTLHLTHLLLPHTPPLIDLGGCTSHCLFPLFSLLHCTLSASAHSLLSILWGGQEEEEVPALLLCPALLPASGLTGGIILKFISLPHLGGPPHCTSHLPACTAHHTPRDRKNDDVKRRRIGQPAVETGERNTLPPPTALIYHTPPLEGLFSPLHGGDLTQETPAVPPSFHSSFATLHCLTATAVTLCHFFSEGRLHTRQ